MKTLALALLSVAKVASGESAVCDAGRADETTAPMCIPMSPFEGTGLLQILTASSTGSLLMEPLQPVDAFEEILLVPKPRQVHIPPSRRVFAVQSFLVVAKDDLKTKLGFLPLVQDLFKMTGSAPVSLEGDSGARLQLHLEPLKMYKEQYELSVSSQGVDIKAATEQGLFYGLMTLRQLVRKQEGGQNATAWRLPEVRVEDRPEMLWRGMMLDVARHFYTPEQVKRFLSLMAMFKLNRFHWHLSDDQGWRFPVKKWPKLTSVGQWRKGTPFDETANFRRNTDNVPYGGSYTKEDIQDVVSHAQSLFIEVVPELDIPGHTQAAIAAYPELGNRDANNYSEPDVSQLFGLHTYTLVPSNTSFQFVRDLVDAMADLIPGQHVHIGGDEVALDQWKTSQTAKNFRRKRKLEYRQTSLLQNFFQEEGIQQAKSRQRRPIVWEEAALRGVSKDAIVSLWLPSRNPSLRVGELTGKGYDVVLSPLEFAYFDYADSGHDEYPAPQMRENLRYTPLSQVYSMGIPPSAGNGRVLGGQANIWTEYIRDAKQLDYRVWPRACALAERLWLGGETAGGTSAFQDFTSRLKPSLSDLEAAGVHFRPPDLATEL
mmetsp:Transcript_30371/g.69909  ORF Transcript_30371/g.69909 Transcript_30371/m.69909 type:complete len:600 (-) Transcript_30371:35-1834(-)